MKIIYLLVFILLSFNSHSTELDSSSSLRTFFTTPQLRKQLDELRASGKYIQKGIDSSAPIIREPLKVIMQGVVIRDNKKPVVFVNDGNTLKSRKIDEGIVVSDKKVSRNLKVPVRVNRQPLNLKPGQSWHESDNTTKDNFLIKPAKEKPKGVNDKKDSGIIE